MKRRGATGFSAATGERLLAGTCLAALAALPQLTLAQTAPDKPADEGIETVTVTTRYIRENIQETPMAITAQTDVQLQAANVTNIGTLGAVVPNLLTVPGDSQSAGTPKIRMRGVIQGESSSLAVPPAVGIYTDDVYHATAAGSELDLVDIDHIEINRGPQSTLSGNASIGGAIKIYTKDPLGDGSGYVSYGRGSRNMTHATAAYDLGLTDTLALRVSGDYQRQDGFSDRLDFTCEMNKLGTPQLAGTFPLSQPDIAARDCVLGHLGGINHTVAQAKLRWRPTEKLDILFAARKRTERDEETPEVALSYQPNAIPNTTNALVEAYNKAVRDAFGIQLDSRFSAPPGTDGYATYATNCRPNINFKPNGFCFDRGKSADHSLYSGKVQYEISDNLRMTAIGAYTEYSNAFTQNGDQSPLGYVISHFDNQDHQGSGELRFDGALFDNKLNWVAGAYMLRLTGYQKYSINFLTTSQQSIVKGTDDSQSAFFHLDYNLTEKWRVSGGARYTDGKIAITINNPPTLVISDPVESKQSRVDWLVSTDYKITDDILVYASAATGSRPPGLTTIVNTSRQVAPTAAEDLVSYEAGVKTDLLDRRLRTNLSFFYTDYKSLATSVQGFECVGQPGATAIWFPSASACQQFAPNTGNVQFFQNFGMPAKIQGAEWEITALPLEHLRFDWTGGYNKFVSGIKTPGQPGYLWPGNHRQPKWNMHADLSYGIQTAFGTFTPRVDWNWQSQQDYDPSSQLRAPLPIYVIKPYSLWNAQIAFAAAQSNWSATLAVTNLTDKFYYYQVLQGTLNAQTRLAAPREFSLSIRKDF
jgi:iron complex outermembrane receptor protein